MSDVMKTSGATPAGFAAAPPTGRDGLIPVTFRAGGFDIKISKAVSIAAFVAIFVAWELVSRAKLVSPLFLPPPSQLWSTFLDLAWSGQLWLHLSASLKRILAGWAIGTSAGVAIGLLLGISTIARSVGSPIVSAVFPIPKIALLPLFILWLGIGETSKIATITFGVFFPTVISTYAGVDAVPRNLIRMGQSFGLPLRTIVTRIILPGALPGMLAGARISSSIALLLVVSAEMIGAEHGIGAFVLMAGNLMQTDQLLVGVLMLSVLGLTFSALLGRAERWLLRWR
jgi:ABC-type nitrate/sulfonate/bicarbonate transport system permease component